ncbi:hypothetical protein PF003_g40258 [Phytophthora fragariae]|nr:hypothetical protein PF003_g40258 [Phytophthora fragariae]
MELRLELDCSLLRDRNWLRLWERLHLVVVDGDSRPRARIPESEQESALGSALALAQALELPSLAGPASPTAAVRFSE